jgi:hypothetical protein
VAVEAAGLADAVAVVSITGDLTDVEAESAEEADPGIRLLVGILGEGDRRDRDEREREQT